MAVHDTCAGERCAPHYVLPQVVALGLVGDAHPAAEVYLEVSGFRKVDVDVRPVVISVIGVVRVVGQVELLHYAVLVEIAKGDEVAEAGRASGQGDIVLGLPGLVLEDVVVPVHIREHYRVTAGFEHIQDEGAEFQGAFGDFRVVRPLGLIVYLCIFQAAHALKVTQRLGDSILGGEGDATNVIPTPILSVITKISYDHMNYLGDSLEEIAKAKAGIIKKGGAVLLQKQKDSVMPVFLNRIKEVDGNLLPLHTLPNTEELHLSEWGDGAASEWSDLLGLKGVYQTENASLAYSAAIALKNMGYDISNHDLFWGLKNAKWPGRFEVLSKEPLFIIDGAHNEDGAKALATSLKRIYNGRKFLFIIGILADKEYEKMLEELLPFASKVLCVTPLNPRALSAKELSEVIKKKNPALQVMPCKSVEEALQKAYYEENEDTVAFGSLYYIGEIRRRFFESL